MYILLIEILWVAKDTKGNSQKRSCHKHHQHHRQNNMIYLNIITYDKTHLVLFHKHTHIFYLHNYMMIFSLKYFLRNLPQKPFIILILLQTLPILISLASSSKGKLKIALKFVEWIETMDETCCVKLCMNVMSMSCHHYHFQGYLKETSSPQN